MARSLAGLPDYLRARGFQVDGVPGWLQRGRPRSSGGYEPRGIVAHHTGGGGKGIGYASTSLTNGFRDLPGPLCQLNLDRDGTVIFIAAGRANHAGKVRSIDWMRAGDGNAQALGIEANNTGTEGWKHPAPGWGTQYDAYVALCAAIEDYMGWKRGSVLGHGEVSTAGKWDPGIRRNVMLDMDEFRRRVRGVRFDVDAPKPPVTPTPVPEPTPEPDVDRTWGVHALVNYKAASAGLKTLTAQRAWTARKNRLTDEVADIDADIEVGLECGSGARYKHIDAQHRANGKVVVPGGRGGRHLWRDVERTTLTASGYFDPPRRKGNDKPAPWMVGTLDGKKIMVVGGHLDPEDPTGSWQVRQARAILKAALEVADRYDVAPASIIFMLDTASDNRVRREVFQAAGFADVFDVARRTVNKGIKSYNQGKAPRRGPRVDLCAVYYGRGPGRGGEYARPVRVANQRITLATDHHHQVFRTELQPLPDPTSDHTLTTPFIREKAS